MMQVITEFLHGFGITPAQALEFLRIAVAVLGTLVAIAIALARFAHEKRKQVEAEHRKRLEAELWEDGIDLQAKLDGALAGLKDALSVVQGLETHIKARADAATKLKSEIDHYKGVQAVQKEQVDAIAAVLNEQLKSVQREDQRLGFRQDAYMNTFFMLVGAIVSYFIAKWLG